MGGKILPDTKPEWREKYVALKGVKAQEHLWHYDELERGVQASRHSSFKIVSPHLTEVLS